MVNNYYGYGHSGWAWEYYDPYRYGSQTHIYSYELGALIFDVIDPKTNQLMWRGSAEAEVKKRGGKTTSSVSRKTTCVVAGENPGTKAEKAGDLGIKIISEETFIKLIEAG